ncbi:MAG: precorrin-6A reductase [Clostridia bacterium]|nr:precorrin-6A reductase [Clostridia bacterium]
MCNICIFAGTSEGRRLVQRLSGRGARLTVCVATAYGEDLMGASEGVRVLAGRMDAGQMEALFRSERFDAVVDATHPYADRATENIAAACEAAGVQYLRLLRASSADEADGVFVKDVAACVQYLRGTEGPVLLTTGSKELPAFCADEALRSRLCARVLPTAASLQTCLDCGLAPDRIIAMQGPFDEEMNLATLRAVKARFLVTKDTGSAGGYEAKIRAAMKASAQAVIIGRPPQREGFSLEEITAKLEARFNLFPIPKKVTLAGVGMGDAGTRTLALEEALREADCLIGAKRMLEAVDCAGKRVCAAYMPKDVGRLIREDQESRRFVVLLSGDTGFYSGAKGLLEELRDMEVTVLPGISSLQYFCAKLGRPWEDVFSISLHGREGDLARAVREHPAVFALVGGEDGAKKALSRLVEAGLGGVSAAVGERLGYPDERIARGPASELAEGRYDSLSVILAENPLGGRAPLAVGLPEDAFDRDETPMTKSEVRAVSISKLALKRDAVVYDVGSGSGSVTVEAALLASRVYAVEMKPQAVALTRRNAIKFHLENVAVIEGKAPDALESLPPPTHAFIGGSSGSMRGIVECLLRKNPSVRIVANAVTLESVAELSEIAKEFTHSDISEIAVSKPRQLGRYRLMTAQNPVYVFAMWNEKDETAEGGVGT